MLGSGGALKTKQKKKSILKMTLTWFEKLLLTQRQLSRFVFSSWIDISADSLEENLLSYKSMSLQLSSQITSSNSFSWRFTGVRMDGNCQKSCLTSDNSRIPWAKPELCFEGYTWERAVSLRHQVTHPPSHQQPAWTLLGGERAEQCCYTQQCASLTRPDSSHFCPGFSKQ